MSDEVIKEEGGVMDSLKDKIVDAVGLGGITEKIENLVDSAKEKIGGILGDKGEDMIDSVVEKVEDKIESVTGHEVDLNNEEPKA